jgi:hydrogenase 3 maturation protease
LIQKTDLSQILKGKVVFVGIGNPLRGDDGFGPLFVQKLQGQVSAACLDAGNAPETFTGKIIREKPDTIVFVDAVHLGLPPGHYAVLGKEDLLKTGFTTHDLSPHMLIQYLESQVTADIYLLGVQPVSVEFGAEMSEAVSKTMDDLFKVIKEAIHA